MEMEMGMRKWKYENGNESQDEEIKRFGMETEMYSAKTFPQNYFTQLGNVFTATRTCETMKMITF